MARALTRMAVRQSHVPSREVIPAAARSTYTWKRAGAWRAVVAAQLSRVVGSGTGPQSSRSRSSITPSTSALAAATRSRRFATVGGAVERNGLCGRSLPCRVTDIKEASHTGAVPTDERPVWRSRVRQIPDVDGEHAAPRTAIITPITRRFLPALWRWTHRGHSVHERHGARATCSHPLNCGGAGLRRHSPALADVRRQPTRW
jgi:hypothetical protein